MSLTSVTCCQNVLMRSCAYSSWVVHDIFRMHHLCTIPAWNQLNQRKSTVMFCSERVKTWWYCTFLHFVLLIQHQCITLVMYWCVVDCSHLWPLHWPWQVN